MTPKAYRRLACLLTSVAGLAFAGGDAAAQQFACPKKGGEFVFAQEAKVNSLDMHTSSAISTRNVAMNMFESLMTRDDNFSPIPELAASVEEAKAAKTYSFQLRHSAKFHTHNPPPS